MPGWITFWASLLPRRGICLAAGEILEILGWRWRIARAHSADFKSRREPGRGARPELSDWEVVRGAVSGDSHILGSRRPGIDLFIEDGWGRAP